MRKPLRIAAVAAAALVLAGGIFLLVVALGCPPVETLRDYRAPQERIVVPLAAMSPLLVRAFLSVEDHRFYQHHGIDWRRVGGAFLYDLRTLSFREGSRTISM